MGKVLDDNNDDWCVLNVDGVGAHGKTGLRCCCSGVWFNCEDGSVSIGLAGARFAGREVEDGEGRDLPRCWFLGDRLGSELREGEDSSWAVIEHEENDAVYDEMLV